MHGRVVDKNGKFLMLLNHDGVHKVELSVLSSAEIGDIVEISEGRARLLTKSKSCDQKWSRRILDPRRLRAMKVRTQVEKGISEFFENQGFQSVKTPTLVRSPGMETHIKPYRLTTGEFIPTSPEFAMKKLLVGGLEKIFQICPAFRYEPNSESHSPEFTILEWYRAYAGYEEIMSDFEKMIESLAVKINGSKKIKYGSKIIDVTAPWPRLKVRELFLEFAGVDLVKEDSADKLAHHVKRLGLDVDTSDTWDDLYFKIWLNFIENKLPQDRGVFVYRYPASQSALSVVDKDSDGSFWARRFEPYAGGLELGNAFEELTDPLEQKNRFINDMNLRENIYGADFPKNPIDEEFIEALEEGMPPSGGIAVGVDRLVMLLADEPDIDYTLWLPSYIHKS